LVKKINHTRAENTTLTFLFAQPEAFLQESITNKQTNKQKYFLENSSQQVFQIFKDSNQHTQIHEFQQKDRQISNKPIVFVLD
jgi:hypothetical protein